MGAEARRSLYEYCRLNQKQYLLDEWDDGRNLPLTPQTITSVSYTHLRAHET